MKVLIVVRPSRNFKVSIKQATVIGFNVFRKKAHENHYYKDKKLVVTSPIHLKKHLKDRNMDIQNSNDV